MKSSTETSAIRRDSTVVPASGSSSIWRQAGAMVRTFGAMVNAVVPPCGPSDGPATPPDGPPTMVIRPPVGTVGRVRSVGSNRRRPERSGSRWRMAGRSGRRKSSRVLVSAHFVSAHLYPHTSCVLVSAHCIRTLSCVPVSALLYPHPKQVRRIVLTPHDHRRSHCPEITACFPGDCETRVNYFCVVA